jgi:hypothetical protein
MSYPSQLSTAPLRLAKRGEDVSQQVSFNLTNANPVPVDINVAKSSLAAITLTLASLANSTGEVLPLPPSPLVPLPANATNAAQCARSLCPFETSEKRERERCVRAHLTLPPFAVRSSCLLSDSVRAMVLNNYSQAEALCSLWRCVLR